MQGPADLRSALSAAEREWIAILESSSVCAVQPDEDRRQAAPACSSESLAEVRVQQLLNELATLKESHAEAVATAVAEREARLAEREEHFRQIHALLRQAADALLTFDTESVIRSANDAAERMLGHCECELVGRSLSDIMDSHGSQATQGVLQLLDHAVQCKTPVEVTLLRADGRPFTAEMAVSRVLLGEESLYFASFRDTSERRMLEAQLRQAQKMESIGQLASGIAHEINTPVQYIGDNTAFVLDAVQEMEQIVRICLELRNSESDVAARKGILGRLFQKIQTADLEYLFEEVPKALRETLDGVKRVANIVHAMKEFAHPGGGAKQAVDLNRAVQNAVTVARNEWKYVADVELQLDSAAPPIKCYPDDMNQVILNLIINAAHAIGEKIGANSEAKGKITIVTRRCGNDFELRVTDTGTGIPKAIRSRIFDPFSRRSRSARERAKDWPLYMPWSCRSMAGQSMWRARLA